MFESFSDSTALFSLLPSVAARLVVPRASASPRARHALLGLFVNTAKLAVAEPLYPASDWRRRDRDEILMDIPGLVAPYGLGPRSASDSPPLASAGTIGGPADLNMLSYSNSSMGNLMSLPPSGYGFNSLPATTSYSPYSHGPNPTYLPHSLSHMHVGRTPASRDLPPVREARNAMPVSDRSAHVKAEEEMPMRSGSTYYPINSYMEHDIAGPTNSTDEGRFATGVDTLMKAIQAKSQPGQQQQSPTVSPEIRPSTSYFSNRQPQVGFNIPYDNVYNDWTNETASHSNNVVTGETSPQQQHGARSKAKKRYQCEVPGCYKSFYQKTHLEIHTRAHTGFKPFVSCLESSIVIWDERQSPLEAYAKR
ncbi:MAG: hypothetical protein M1819_001327 [Sarea resinae]|nr:MAG: hypothetical protein M1819_001327 [Sarea resinae]